MDWQLTMRAITHTIPSRDVTVTGCNNCPYLGTDGGGPGTILICNHPKFQGYEGAIIDNRHLDTFPEKCPILPENKDRPVDKVGVVPFTKVSMVEREQRLKDKILPPRAKEYLCVFVLDNNGEACIRQWACSPECQDRLVAVRPARRAKGTDTLDAEGLLCDHCNKPMEKPE